METYGRKAGSLRGNKLPIDSSVAEKIFAIFFYVIL